MGVLADGCACGFLEAYVGDDCLYIGFHLCVGLIFIFLRYPDAIVIELIENDSFVRVPWGMQAPCSCAVESEMFN